MHEIITTINQIGSNQVDAKGKYPIANFGIFACSNQINIKNVPFDEPCLIIILSGVKTVHLGDDVVHCQSGDCLAVSAPCTLSFINTPDKHSGEYQAMGIPFDMDNLRGIRHFFPLSKSIVRSRDKKVVYYPYSGTFFSSVQHYLTTEKEAQPFLLKHRVTDVLLTLAQQNHAIFEFLTVQESWGQKVRAILSEDITQAWEIKTICDRLAVSESTLRRSLRKEGWNFRGILKEVRLSTALMHLLQTNYPIYQIAAESGYESASRFTENFRDRFGVVPTKFRETNIKKKTETE